MAASIFISQKAMEIGLVNMVKKKEMEENGEETAQITRKDRQENLDLLEKS